MQNNTGIIVGVVAVAIILGGVYVSMGTKDDVVVDMQRDGAEMMEKAEDTMMKQETMDGESMMQKEEMGMTDMNMEKDAMMQGTYEAYAPEKLARAETGDVVLFFHASWCPSCRGLSADIEKNKSSIPGGVSILKVDYDKETELKKKYGVTYQHTLVQVDAGGNMIKKWSGSPKLDTLVSEIQ